MSVSPAAAAAELLSRRQARRGLLAFTQYTYPQYKADRAHALIAAALDRVVAGELKRLIIVAPPQHGKSELTSVRLPAYWLGRRPHDPIIVASYGAELAEGKSRQARDIVESAEYRALFGELRAGNIEAVQVRPDSRAVQRWQLLHPHRGGLIAVGVGGPVTGHGARLGIIDDPHENWEEAQSETMRRRVWEWYRGTFRTRIWEGGAIILMMCMTGDTPVLMADGTECPLSDVKVGDRVATYDNGKLGTSTVQNHKSNGLDSVFRIKTTCGKIVYANERHPFLIEEHGQLRWIRLKNLTTVHRIVTVRGSGANGKERPVSLTAATNQLARGAIVPRTMERRCGPMGIAPQRLTQSIDATCASSNGTESRLPSMMPCTKRKAVNAPFADSHLATTCALIGAENYVLTTATIQTPCEGFCVTTAILPWDTPRQRQPHSPLLNTSDFTTAQIESIEPAGVKEVFDIQIERTENFIANGLVSHNTRWHEDDLVGKLLKEQPGQWTVLRLPALAESQEERDENHRHMGIPLGEADPLGRQPGEALAPQRYSAPELASIQRDVGPMVWGAEYQGSPRAPEGNLIQRAWLSQTVPAAPATPWRVRYWDKAASTSASAKYSAGVRLSITPDGRVTIEHVVRGQWTTQERRRVMLQTAEQDAQAFRNGVINYIEQEPGSSGLDSVTDEIRLLRKFPVFADRPSGDKDTRLMPFVAQAAALNVFLLAGAWHGAYIDELVAVPTGYYRDQADATAGAYNRCLELIDILPAGTIVVEEPVQISVY